MDRQSFALIFQPFLVEWSEIHAGKLIRRCSPRSGSDPIADDTAFA
jgi:hypothetical protein